MICESGRLADYTMELKEVNFSHPLIKEKAQKLFCGPQTEIEKIDNAFRFVRDEVLHSWDIQSKRVTCDASDVLAAKEGICYAKSHLLAALLRPQGIPAGFCYQRLMLFDTPEKGYCIHALNAVFVRSINKWIRLDARGNKIGIDAQFSLQEEKIAFTVDERQDETDYPLIYTKPHPATVAVLREHNDALEMYKHHLPEKL